MSDSDMERTQCVRCREAQPLGFDFTMAFQPILAIRDNSIYGYEALVRGLEGESAWEILSRVNEGNRYSFDQNCRVKAVELAARLGITQRLSINFLPKAIYEPQACIRTTVAACEEYGFPLERIMFEVSERENVTDHDHLKSIFQYYRKRGFTVAIDDFGAGFAGLGLLAEFTPHVIKCDMGLIRDIDTSVSRQAIVKGVVAICRDLGVEVIAEGVETRQELAFLADLGIELFQGYLFARPELEALPEPDFSAWRDL